MIEQMQTQKTKNPQKNTKRQTQKNPKRQTQKKTKNQHKDFLIQYTEDKHENLFANNPATRQRKKYNIPKRTK